MTRPGAPVSGAIVSAVGGRTLTGTTDAKGRCTLAELPAGEYLVRVHRAGFGAPHSLVVRVTAGSRRVARRGADAAARHGA